jgi:hypothetical protein
LATERLPPFGDVAGAIRTVTTVHRAEARRRGARTLEA